MPFGVMESRWCIHRFSSESRCNFDFLVSGGDDMNAATLILMRYGVWESLLGTG